MINKVMRYMSNKITDVRDTILLYQYSHIKSKTATTASPVTTMYIPVGSDITNIEQIHITPVKSANSANLVALASGFEANLASFGAQSDLPAWVKNNAYEEDQAVYDNVTQKAYLCNTAHTSTNEDNVVGAGFAKDVTKWTPIIEQKFTQITFTTPGDAKILDANVMVVGR